jgi:hypothetical protein
MLDVLPLALYCCRNPGANSSIWSVVGSCARVAAPAVPPCVCLGLGGGLGGSAGGSGDPSSPSSNLWEL